MENNEVFDVMPSEMIPTAPESVDMTEHAPTPKKPRAVRAKTVKQVNPFTEALKFISLASNSKGGVYESHCMVKDGFIISTDSIITCGHPIGLGADFNPKTENLKTLLTQFPTDFTISVKETSTVFSCGDFVSDIPCVSDAEFNTPAADAIWGPINSNIVEGIKATDKVLPTKSEFVMQNCLKLESNLITGSDGQAVLQYWHGWALPYDTLIPRAAGKAVMKASVGKIISGIGYGAESVTFYFEDGAWIRTQIFAEAYPNVASFFDHIQATPAPVVIDKEIFVKLKVLDTLSEDGTIFFRDSVISNYPNNESGSRYDFTAFPDVNSIYPYGRLSLGDNELFNTLQVTDNYAYFGGNTARLIIKALKLNEISV